MKIGIKKENGLIYFQAGVNEANEYQLTNAPYNFKVVDVGNYYDCNANDFNEDLSFNIEKYTARKEKEKNNSRIIELKENLAKSDYKAIKFAEGQLSTEEYEPIKLQRQAWRAEINLLEGN